MITLKRSFNLIANKSFHLACLSSFGVNIDDLSFGIKYSADERKRVLEALNTFNAEDLARFDVTESRIRNIMAWKKKRGLFNRLDDILDVDGIGMKGLDRLCYSILNVDNLKPSRTSRKQYLTPSLNEHRIANIASVIGLHLGPSGISWTKLIRETNSISDWDYFSFSNAPKKMSLPDTFALAATVLDMIPQGDIYIFEATPNLSPQTTKPASVVTSYNQQQELISMLLALINTSSRHLVNLEENAYGVYFLKAHLSARLFKTLVGTERVSSMTVVKGLLDEVATGEAHSFPCSPIRLKKTAMEKYYMHSSIVRELLGQSLLLAITFMEICIYKNPNALDAILPQRKSV